MSVNKRSWTTAAGEEKEAWVCRYVDGGGKRRLKTFARKRDADSFELTTKQEVKEGTHVPSSESVTVAQAGEDWIRACEHAGLERSTVEAYRQHLNHITPIIGRLMLPKISVATVRGMQDKLREKGCSASMVRRVTVSLGSLLAEAQERKHVSRNVVREIAKTKDRRGERRRKARVRVGVDIPTPQEISQILAASEGRFRPLLMVAIFAGLRASELRGLTWNDVDFERREIHVRQRADKFHEIGMPKSSAGQRTIPIGVNLVNTLKEWKLQCPKGKLGLAFPNGAGNIEFHANIVKRGLIPPQIKAGMVVDSGKVDDDGAAIMVAKYPGLHALRHFFASWCINLPAHGGLGLPPKVVQERMGHSSITMTMDTYGHLFPSNDDSDALAAAELRLLSAANAT